MRKVKLFLIYKSTKSLGKLTLFVMSNEMHVYICLKISRLKNLHKLVK